MICLQLPVMLQQSGIGEDYFYRKGGVREIKC